MNIQSTNLDPNDAPKQNLDPDDVPKRGVDKDEGDDVNTNSMTADFDEEGNEEYEFEGGRRCSASSTLRLCRRPVARRSSTRRI